MFFFNDYADKLREVANSSKIKSIIESDEYYFQKALNKYDEFKQITIDVAVVNDLIAQTKETPFSYEKLLNKYQTNTQEHQVLNVIGELISYIDKNAAMKNILNEYDNKRTMALVSVRQNIWVESFLKLKRDDRINNLPGSVQNAIKYIEQPDKTISVFSDNRKEQIFRNIFDGKNGDLFACMHEIGIKSKNPMNDGYVFSEILHSEKIRTLWDTNTKENKDKKYAAPKNIEKIVNDSEENTQSNASFLKWFAPLINALKNLGGEGSPSQVREKIIENCNISENELAETRGKNNSNKFSNEVAFAREYLKKDGYLDASVSGIWKLTDKGWKCIMDDVLASDIFKRIVKLNQLARDGKAIESEEVWQPYTKKDFLSDVFLSDAQYETLVALLKRKKNIILQGAPGVGKTYAAKRLAYSFMGEKDENRVKVVQFHQSYSYEDFIMGYRPDENGFSLHEGSFFRFCKCAESDQDKPYFFIIDEINRGNLSKIFGELLMLIESDKRGEKMVLTYSNAEFSVPGNLHIIGMMNTADRSLAIIDYALRRRFCFFELEPAFDTEIFLEYLLNKGVDNGLAKKIIAKLNYINKEIERDPNLGSGFRIGHSYFCDCKNINNDWFNNIIKYEIAPLLEEYWFDDLEIANGHIGELLK